MSMTLADVRTATRDLLNESSAVFFSDAEIDRWIGQAALDISTVCHCVEATTNLAMATADGDYSLVAGTLQVVHAVWASTRQALRKVTASLLGETSTDATGDQPLRWFQWGAVWYPEPVPNSTANGGTVTVFSHVVTNDITAIPDSCQILAIWYAVAMGKFKDKRPAEGTTFLTMYSNGLAFRRTDLFQREPHTETDMAYALMPQLTGGQSRAA